MNRSRSKQHQSRIAQLRARKNFSRNVARVLLQALALAGFAVLYYIAISLFFDTPYELYLKHSSERLRTEYEALHSRYDSLDMVLSNIEERDRNIFYMLFEASPNDLDSEQNESRLDIYESTLNIPTDRLIKLLEQRCNSLDTSTQSLVASTQQMVINIEKQGKASAKIPAIQPITNRQLTLLTASFGMKINPFYKNLQPHQGVDYTVPEGTRIFATADGVIKGYNVDSSHSGKSILIDHGNGYESYYAHLSKIDIPRSRRVKRGDIIGMTGNTGLSLTPHLHYEVRYNGEAIDPINYMFMELSPTEYNRLTKIAQTGMQAFD